LSIVLVLATGCGRFGFASHTADDGGLPDGGTRAGGLAHRGELLLVETFEDDEYSGRDWYDITGSAGGTPAASGERGASFECTFDAGGTHCAGGDMGRHGFAPTESIYLSWWVRYSPGYEGATELWVFTTADSEWVGGADSRLSTTLGMDLGGAGIRFADHDSVDPRCVQLSSGEVLGCGGGAVEDYAFSEMRSVCGCNGIVGDVRAWECSGSGDSFWTGCWWDTNPDALLDGEWHLIEVFLQMNSISGGVGVPDGSIRYWLDGDLRTQSDAVLMRTGAVPDLAFDQVMLRPFRGDGAEQMVWIDDLTVARGRVP